MKQVQIGSAVEIRHAGCLWHGRVFNIQDGEVAITVDGYPGIFYCPSGSNEILPL